MNDRSPDPRSHMSRNFKLLAQDTLNGFGNIGEGMAMQAAPDGRRILWLAHERAPKNFTGVDVTDPRKPRVIIQTEIPEIYRRSNSLEVCGNILAVAYQCRQVGLSPAGFELFDVSSPENPKSIGFFDCSGPHSRGVHQLWFCDGEYVHISSGSGDAVPRHPRDDQFYRIIDVRSPSKPVEVGRWWLPGTHEGDAEPPPARREKAGDGGFRVHNTNVYPQRPDRAYLGYIDGGVIILDIADKSAPKMISRWNPHPPYSGFTHTVLPLFDRGLLIVTEESVVDNAEDWPKLVWVLDARNETNLIPISTLPQPAYETFAKKGGRYGPHNIHENTPVPTAWSSDQIVIGTFFNGGVRAFDIANPFQPKEIGYFVPAAPEGSTVGTSQLNEVFVDDRGIVYTADRLLGGLYILEMDF